MINNWPEDDEFYGALAIQAAADDDMDTLGELLSKIPISQDDPTWLGYGMEDYIQHLSPKGTRLLAQAGLNLNVSDYGFLPLHVAIDRSGQMACDLVQVLLEERANPNLKGFNDWTALHRVVWRAPQNTKLMAILLSGGADPRIKTEIDHCSNPIEDARRLGHVEAAKFIEAHWTLPVPARKTPKPR